MIGKDVQGKKKVNKTKRNYWFDIALAGALVLTVVAAEVTLLHQGLAFFLAAGILLHLIWHWQWIVSITKRFFGKLPAKTRWLYVANWLLLVTLLLTMFTGMALSPTFVASPVWFMSGLHELSSSLFLGSIGMHLALHLKWIWSSTKRYLLQGWELEGAASWAVAGQAAVVELVSSPMAVKVQAWGQAQKEKVWG